MEFVLYNKRIKRTRLLSDPVFIIGHWRSGTTYLHNLLCCDNQFGFPTTFQCLLPGAFLTGKELMKSIHRITLPETRFMDKVKMHPDYPQEEEFAISSLTAFSCYQSLFFPVNMIKNFKSFALMETNSISKWEKQYLNFLKKITLSCNGKQLILKNPVNTARIQHLLKLFPDAKFIYIHRKQEEVLKSTHKLYNAFLSLNSFQFISDIDIKKNIMWIYNETISQYEKSKCFIPKNHLVEIDYADLIRSPFPELGKIYRQLHLNGFGTASAHFRKYISEQTTYLADTYELTEN
jgi:hypothetical protein